MKKRCEIGAYLDVLLAERGMRQTDLAERAGFSDTLISEVVRGRRILSASNISSIGAALESSKVKRSQIEKRLHWLAALACGYIVAEINP